MPSKKSTRKQFAFPKDFAPFVFEMGIVPDEDGGLLVRYESTDDRAHAVCGSIVDAITESLGLQKTEVWTGITAEANPGF
jgi:hypothetical protein